MMVYTYDTNIQFADFQKKKYKEFLNLITLIEKIKSLYFYILTIVNLVRDGMIPFLLIDAISELK